MCSVSMQSVEIMSFCIAIPNFCSTAPIISTQRKGLETYDHFIMNVIVGSDEYAESMQLVKL